MDEQKTGLLEEAPGVASSKRWAGFTMIAGGGLLLLGIGVAAIFREIADSSAALGAGQALVITGAALLGVTVLEGLGRR